MNQDSISFHDEAGQITGVLTADSRSIQENKRIYAGRWVQGSHDGAAVYVDNGVVTPRPESPARLDGMTLRDLPTPGTIHIGDAQYPYDEPTVELEFEHPGTYKVRVESWPHLDKEFDVENPPR